MKLKEKLVIQYDFLLKGTLLKSKYFQTHVTHMIEKGTSNNLYTTGCIG